MAIAKMARLRLLGLKSDKNKIMNELVRSGSFEVVPATCAERVAADKSHLDKAMGRQAKVAFAIGYLTACANEYLARREKNYKEFQEGLAQPIRLLPIDEKTHKKNTSGRAMIGQDDFYDVAAKEYELITVCDELEKLSLSRVEYKSQLQKNAMRQKVILPYREFPLEFSALGDGNAVSVMLCHTTADRSVDFGELPVFAEQYATEKGTLLGVVALLRDKEAVSNILSAAGFTQCGLRDDSTAAQLLEECKVAETRLRTADTNAMYDALAYYKYLSELKILYDVIGQDIEKTNAELAFAATDSTFVAEGWVPADITETLLEKIRANTKGIVASVTEPQEGDTPPTLIVSKKIMKPYEDVTNMYSVPAYGEIDPNPFMAVFFFLFFGIMIGDAGYGLILTLASVLICRFCKLEKGTSRLIALVGMGGVSAIIWGLLFGGVFAIDAVPALWFNPIDEPLMMLGVSIILGAVQLLAGYALNMAQQFRAHKPVDAILDNIFIFILFAGLACMALDMLLEITAPLMTVGLILLGVSLLGILCTAGRHNKGILGKIMGGFSGLYGLVNLLSDLLSYARLFGLGLASGAIGIAFNTLGGMFFSIPAVGYVIGIIFLIPLHAFNLGIGVLGAYVHNARLQFLEFYGKFYQGDGRPFSPLGEKTKYVRFS